MPSRAGLPYLERQKILLRPAGAGLHEVGALHSHRRPIVPLSALLEPDTPLRRVYTQEWKKRQAWKNANQKPLEIGDGGGA
jgi:hypothetical protein